MRGRRGQFTIFVILGFVLMVAFAFMLFARSVLVENKLNTDADKIVEEAIKSSNINFYVKSCLERVSEDAIYLMALQGGRLYESQGGNYPNLIDSNELYYEFNLSDSFYDVSFYNFTNISYGILPNYNATCVYTSPPYQPMINTSIDSLKVNYRSESILDKGCRDDSGAVGINALPKLCDPEGANIVNSSGEEGFLFFGQCSFGYGNYSIQHQLEIFISNGLKKCVDFTIFEKAGYNVDVLNEPQTTVLFADKFLVVSVEYPFIVRFARSAIKTKAKFEMRKNIRLKQLYEFIQEIVSFEYKDVKFKLERDYKNPDFGWDNKISLTRIINPCDDCPIGTRYDDLYQIIDNDTIIRGVPLVFQFVVRNRAPVLDWIDFGQRFNIIAKEGDWIDLRPRGIDPDGNYLSYEYSGWREDHTSLFLESNCLGAGVEYCREHIGEFVDINIEPAQNWTRSNQYQTTLQNASYRATRDDVGLHHVIITIEDEQGLIDYQNISIMVGDNPVVIPSGDNFFDDIGSNNASIEDNYLLSGLARSYFTDITQFRWTDNDEPFSFITDEPETLFPVEQFVGLIEDIDNRGFTNRGTHQVGVQGGYTLEGSDSWTDPSYLTLEVFDCLPHRSEAAPYPYNSESSLNIRNSIQDYIAVSDDFMGDHTCCGDGTNRPWGTIIPASDNKLCYEYGDYGSIFSINLDLFNRDPLNPAMNDDWGTHSINPYDYATQNNIFFRTFERECDGQRGNICAGYSWQTVVEVAGIGDCPETNLDENGVIDFSPDERCLGPTSLMASTRNDPGIIPCRSTYGTTFESRVVNNYNSNIRGIGVNLGITGTGSCNHDEKCVTLPNDQNGYRLDRIGPETNWLCQATCDNGIQGNCDATVDSLCEDCRDEDVVPTGQIRADLSNYNGACNGGGTGTCSPNPSDRCISNLNNIPADSTSDGCVNMGELIYQEAIAIDTNGNNINDTCSVQQFYLDDNGADICNHCVSGNSNWINDQCCGNNPGEVTLQSNIGVGGDYGCCPATAFCVYEGNCYSPYDYVERNGNDYECEPQIIGTETYGVWVLS